MEPTENAPSPRPERGPGRRDGTKHHVPGKAGLAALTLGALGVVFGDIGTSPLYALHALFAANDGQIVPNEENVLGVISLIVWSVTLIVSVKYVTFVMKADNGGEGGIMALIALLQRVRLQGRLAKAALVALGIFGASLFYGDGMITPAISVLSAVEGLEVASPGLEPYVIEIALAVLAVLFVVQRFGTGAVGRAFGPVMVLWFGVLGAFGLRGVLEDPGVLRALSPTYGLEFMASQPGIAFVALASVVLAVTGAEALYADMGHFGRKPISRAWFFYVFPALTLNYLGQASLILRSPEAIESPFFLLAPSWARFALVILATLATVIASQAVISGAFSVTRQAVQLGFLPRLTIRHTSDHEVGQVYVPIVNWGIFAAVVVLVVGFGSSEALASAYGIAVTGTLAIDTILFFVVVRMLWKRSLGLVIAGAIAFLIVDLTFLAANLSKVLDGGWFPLAIAAGVCLILLTWQRGRRIVTANRTEEEGPLRAFVDHVHTMQPPVFRAPGTAVFLNANPETTPIAMRANVEHNGTLHEQTIILTIQVETVPHVSESERLTIDDLGYGDDGITHVTARFGFQDEPNVPAALCLATDASLEGRLTFDPDTASYFLSRITIVPTKDPGMAQWRKRLFVGISRNAANTAEFFGLPDERTVVMGAHIDL